MPRSTSGVYSKPAGTTAVAGTVISPVTFNTLIDDIAADLNLSRPYPWAGFITPMQFGAAGDGVTDDGVALNAAFAFLRSEAIAGRNPVLTGQGREYLSSISINGTGIRGTSSTQWNWRVQDITIIGACAGKPVLDCIGTRGGRWDNVSIWGDRTNRPTVGWQFARAATPPFDFCDNHTFIDCHVDGFYTVAARHAYGQESCAYIGCHWWNRDICGTCSIAVGSDNGVPAMASDYMAPMTGSTSMINNTYLRCEDRSVPWDDNRLFSISNITRANPAVVTTTAAHSFANGNTICITNAGGMDGELDVWVGTIAGVTATTFQLVGLDTSALAAYTSGGQAIKAQTGPTAIIGRISGTTFHEHYFVNYGTDAVQWVFPDTNPPARVTFCVLVEGAPKSQIRFRPPNVDVSIHGFTWDVEQQRVHESVMAIDAATTGIVRLTNGHIKANNALHTSRPLISTPSRFSLRNQDLFSPLTAEIYLYSFANFIGTAYAFDMTGGVQHHGNTYLREPVIYAPLFGDNAGQAWVIPEAGGSLNPYDNLGKNIGALTKRVSTIHAFRLDLGATDTDGITISRGAGSPEGVLSARVGSTYHRIDGGAGTSFYVKESGSGSTGWVGK